MSAGTAIIIVEVFMWAGGAFFLLWLDRRNLNRARAEAARRKTREAEARATPSPAMVPTTSQGSAPQS